MVLTVVVFVLAVVVGIVVIRAVRVVPQQRAFVVERLGKYHSTLEAGLHLLIPVIDRVSYRFGLQETTLDSQPQPCITLDNAQVEVDAILYYRVTDAKAAAYGTADFRVAIENLAKTTLRSEVGKRDLDTLLRDRQAINTAIVSVLDEASTSWGVKVLRYEVRDIEPPQNVLRAMELQLTAEREKRAAIAKSEGQKTQQINIADGEKAAAIANSEGEKESAINRATGEAESIRLVAEATAAAIAQVAEALSSEGGDRAANLRVAEQYVAAFGNIAKETNTVVLPANLGDLGSMIAGAMSIAKGVAHKAS